METKKSWLEIVKIVATAILSALGAIFGSNM